MPDFGAIIAVLEETFGGIWKVVLRLHPQLTARKVKAGMTNKNIIDSSNEDDMCEVLGAADVLVTDYSAMTFDAAYINIPVFLYVYDLRDYIKDRGELMWDLETLSFPIAENMFELVERVESFDNEKYYEDVATFFKESEIKEDGDASKSIVDVIEQKISI